MLEWKLNKNYNNNNNNHTPKITKIKLIYTSEKAMKSFRPLFSRVCVCCTRVNECLRKVSKQLFDVIFQNDPSIYSNAFAFKVRVTTTMKKFSRKKMSLTNVETNELLCRLRWNDSRCSRHIWRRDTSLDSFIGMIKLWQASEKDSKR